MLKNSFKILLLVFTLASMFGCVQERPEFDFTGKNKGQVYFIKVKNQDFEIKPLDRPVQAKQEGDALKELMTHLLSGPTEREQGQNYGTEIPKGTRMLSFDELPEKITIDLSSQFVAGGGSRSMILRQKQLQETIAASGVKKPVYVSIEGKELKVLGGEGLVSESPIFEGKEDQEGKIDKESL